jgi:hypothetical protein
MPPMSQDAQGPSTGSLWDAPASSQPTADPWGNTGSHSPSASSSNADAWGSNGNDPTSDAGAPVTGDEQTVEASAARYLASGDSRGGEHALEAARRYIADGRVDAASDLLLQLIAAGVATHDAQRLLIDVAKSLGKKDVAKAKVQLLVEMLKLEGRTDLAAEVEQLAQAF